MPKKVSNWGKYPVIEGDIRSFRGHHPSNGTTWIPRGMGRCYGDASLAPLMLSNLPRNRYLHFDESIGVLHCEAGVTFAQLLEDFVPRGWFPPVTPGTKFVSLGGAIASDVHGKNHHLEGAISKHLLSFELLLPDGRRITCSRSEHDQIFWATIGGLGLTGTILNLKLKLKAIQSSFISNKHIKARNLEEIFDLLDQFEATTYSVAWLDCLASGKQMGRSILMNGEHTLAEDLHHKKQRQSPLQLPEKKKLSVPLDFPPIVMNKWSMKAFNFAYYHKLLNKEKSFIGDYDSFFYPLDSIHAWNRIYGKKGFVQYQFVIPKEAGKKGMEDILKKISKSSTGSFLTVLKLLGPGEGIMSFPMEGYTLALDFPVSNKLFPMLDELDHMVFHYGGRVYLTKDSRLKANMLEKMYPQIHDFRKVLHQLGNHGQIRSGLAERLNII